MSTKVLIVGRSATGKDTLARRLEKEYDLRQLKSYTTRPKRYPGEDTHIFITENEAETLKDRVAETIINGHTYFATREQVEECDVYVIDPRGMMELVRNMPETDFMLYYIYADPKAAMKAAAGRGDDREREEAIYLKRNADEDAEFTAFELDLMIGKKFADNVIFTKVLKNDYTESWIESASYNISSAMLMELLKEGGLMPKDFKPLDLIDGTTTEQFIAFFEGHRKISDILDFLQFKDAQLAALIAIGGVTPDAIDEFMEFYDYFMENYDEATREARLRIWPEDCLIFRYVEEYDEQSFKFAMEETFREMPDKEKQEVLSLCHTILDIPGNKYLEVFYEDSQYNITLPAMMDEDEETMIFDEMKYYIGYLIADRGYAIISVFNEDETVDVYGIQGLPIGMWGIIPKAQLKRINEEMEGERKGEEIRYQELERTDF